MDTQERDQAGVEMYPVCRQRNDAAAFMRFLGADSGARFAASTREVGQGSGAFRAAMSYMRGLRWTFR